MEFIDTHSHLYSSQFDADRTQVVKEAIAAGVTTILLPNISSKYGVQSIPTLIILKKGEIVATKVGSSLKSDILSWIGSVI